MFDRLKNVLIVDDSSDFRLLFPMILKRFELDVHTAPNGAEAIRHLSQNKVDLIVTDFRMPIMDGVELLNWCRTRKIYSPVIFTTNDGKLMPHEEEALGDCCATLLRKPIDTKLLQAALDAADRFEHHRDCLYGSLKMEYAKSLGEHAGKIAH